MLTALGGRTKGAMQGGDAPALRAPDRPAGHLTNFLAIGIVVALVAVAIAYGIDAVGRRSERLAQADALLATVPVNVSGVALTVPAAWLRFPEQPGSDFSDRLDLALSLDIDAETRLPVTLSLVPKARARASSALLDTVFLQHFSKEELSNAVPGLIGKPLTGSEGYQGETVWYDPIRQDPFTAKCTSPLAEDGANACLRTLVLDSGLSATFGFSEAALADWRKFDMPLAAMLERIGAGRIVR